MHITAGHVACKEMSGGLLVVTSDWSFARFIAPVVTTTSIILGSNNIQNGDIMVPANPGPPGNMTVKTERERERERADHGRRRLFNCYQPKYR